MENIMRTIAVLNNNEVYVVDHYTENIFNRVFLEDLFLKIINKYFKDGKKIRDGNITIIAEKDLEINRDQQLLFSNYGTGVNLYDYRKKYAISANYCNSIFDFDLKEIFELIRNIKKYDEDIINERLAQLRNNNNYKCLQFVSADKFSLLSEFTVFFNMLYFNNSEKVIFKGMNFLDMLMEYKERDNFEEVLVCKPLDWICHDEAIFKDVEKYLIKNKIGIYV